LKTLVERCLELRSHRDANRRHLQRVEAELAAARAFQQGLLPAREATIGRLALQCRYVPCSELGGDLYDYAADGDGRVALLIADVSGHGVSAAMLTGIVKSAFRAAHVEGFEPDAVVHRISAGIGAFDHGRFVTLISALVAPAEGWLSYVNAGHPAGVLWNGHHRLERLESTGPLVSPALPGSVWQKAHVQIGADDQLLLYTDGVPEALTADGDTSGEGRLRAVIERHDAGGSELVDAILAEVAAHHRSHAHHDDFTLVTARIA
jgi:sigma-B regulation protein RsbU (phosphoserine phosphatase)